MKANRGGFEGPEGWVFERTGGALCLDFVNTLDNRPTDDPQELLGTYADLIGWSRQAGIIDEDEAETLVTRAEREPAAAEEILVRARTLREALFAIFSSAVEGSAPPPEALAILNAEIPPALSRQAITRTNDRYQLEGTERQGSLDVMLFSIVRSAVDLLSSQELSRVRTCAAENCAWLFIDRSRNRSRQWCDMSVCGNRAKARRHYRRSKQTSS
jgi:predicted RNA-binding Zn ribbon-like protein